MVRLIFVLLSMGELMKKNNSGKERNRTIWIGSALMELINIFDNIFP